MTLALKGLRFMSVSFRQLLAVMMMMLSASFLTAQEQFDHPSQQGWGVPKEPLNCEMNFQNLEQLSELIKGQRRQNGVLILIARLSNGERQELNRRRLFNVRLKLNTALSVPIDKIIVAEGERSKGFGRVEFYLGGELVGVLLVQKNSDICVGCCDPDERFYPYKEKFESRAQRKHGA